MHSEIDIINCVHCTKSIGIFKMSLKSVVVLTLLCNCTRLCNITPVISVLSFSQVLFNNINETVYLLLFVNILLLLWCSLKSNIAWLTPNPKKFFLLYFILISLILNKNNIWKLPNQKWELNSRWPPKILLLKVV
jgi:hypothetical protein